MARLSHEFRTELEGKLKHIEHAEVIVGQMEQFGPDMKFNLSRRNSDGTVITWTEIDRESFGRGVRIVRRAVEADLKNSPPTSLPTETFLPKLPDLNRALGTLTAAFSRILRMS